MDFSKLDTTSCASLTHKFEILHPVTSAETGSFIEVFGAESDAVRKFSANQLRKLQKQEFENSRARKQKFRELDELRADAIEGALVRVANWENIQWEGKALEFSPDNARKLLTACPWLCEQIIEQSDNLGNFLKA